MHYFRRFSLLLAALLLTAALSQQPATASDTLRVAVMATTDLHGWVLPWDYYADREEPRYGLARVATLIDSVRSRFEQTLLLDAGDWLQGNPLADYFANTDTLSPYVLLEAADFLEYDAMVLGNHEFNFGLDLLNRRIDQTRTPILAANVYEHGTRQPAYPTYVIKDVDGVRIAVVGLTTPGSAVWDRPRVAGRLEFGDGIEAAHRFVAEVRERGADIVIALAHTGYEGTTSYPTDDLGEENFGRVLAETVDGVDLVVTAHTHQTIGSTVVGPDGRTVAVMQPGRWGSHLGIAELTIVRGEGTAEVVDHSVNLQSVEHVPGHPAIEALAENAHQAVRAVMAKPLATTSTEWSSSRARLEPSAAIALVHAAQRYATGAQLSAAAAFNTSATLGPDAITLGQLTRLYPYENALYVVNISGADLRSYLEHSARFYLPPEAPGEAPRVNREWPGFNFDMVDGATYELDLERPLGERVVRLEVDGRPVRDEDVFTMAVNSYRAEGGGGFPGMTESNIVERIDRSVRDIIIEYLQERGSIEPSDVLTRNWSLRPEPTGRGVR
ncbi:MAG: bifunctional metallophosphatase/5'-nucleotidase [Bacteroidota bacterium]